MEWIKTRSRDLIFLAVLIVATCVAFWIVDVRRKETIDALEYKMKRYMDSTNILKSEEINDANQRINDANTRLDSIQLNKNKTKKDAKYVKSLSHNALQLYVDSVYRASKNK